MARNQGGDPSSPKSSSAPSESLSSSEPPVNSSVGVEQDKRRTKTGLTSFIGLTNDLDRRAFRWREKKFAGFNFVIITLRNTLRGGDLLVQDRLSPPV